MLDVAALHLNPWNTLLIQSFSYLCKNNNILRHFLHLAYKGTHYSGWQWQPNAVSVQGTIEAALEKMLKKPMKIHGCGRTDAGVHASQYFAHLDIEENWDFDIVERLNRMLPKDIAIFDLIPTKEGVNTQKDALNRTYDYYIHFRKHPFLSEFSTHYIGAPLDIEKMNAAAQMLTSHRDFRALCKSPDKVPHTRCLVMAAEIVEINHGAGLRLRITASRFLKGMIRLIVTKLLEVGQGKISVSELDTFIGRQENPDYKVLAPPQGLRLSRVIYPFLDIEPVHGFL